MKQFWNDWTKKVSTWILVWVGFQGALGILLNERDPFLDFSFSLVNATPIESPRLASYSLMSVDQVSQVLEDNLDLYPQSKIHELAEHLLKLCNRYRFDPSFVLSMIQVESSFRTRAVSPAGAIGLMQIQPATARVVSRQTGIRYPGTDRALRDPFLNLSLGVAYLAMLRDKYQGLSDFFLVAAYNVGPARMDELLARKGFRPVQTRQYFESIRKVMPKFRFYKAEEI